MEEGQKILADEDAPFLEEMGAFGEKQMYGRTTKGSRDGSGREAGPADSTATGAPVHLAQSPRRPIFANYL